MTIISVPSEKAYRLLNHGATTIVSAQNDGVFNAMSASWVCPLDYDKITAVISTASFTRTLIEKSGLFAVQLPVFAQKDLLFHLGENSRFSMPNKMDGVEIFYQDGFDVPLLKNCAAWLICQVIPEREMLQKYDLFLGKILAAYADNRIFDGGHWLFETAPDELKTLHYVAGKACYLDGKKV
ncbi:MAG: flavin reductase family protein [Cardiobacteriaceae bacterium]|nr:flavin reductase family protein [Cardiobacteriaceae bacterium]